MPRERSFNLTPGSDVVKDTGTVKAVVLADTYAWQEPIPNTNPVQYQRHEADPPKGTSSAKGVEIEVTQAELDRAAAMTPPGLAKAGSQEAKRFLGELSPIDPKEGLSGLSDEDLAAIVTQRHGNPDGMKRDELIGFVAGQPDNPSSNPAAS